MITYGNIDDPRRYPDAGGGKTKAGKFSLFRFTVKKRMRAKLHAIRDTLLKGRHRPIPAQGEWLASVVRGYFAYFAVPTNSKRLMSFRDEIARSWFFALRRRSQLDRLRWTRMNALAERYLPRVRIVHPWPPARFAAKTQGRSRVR